jgi:DNA-directed RNA polymerase specialized sigma24 family protein
VGRAVDAAERVALVALARRGALLYTHRHRLRHEDLEDCFSQATMELVGWARAGGTFLSTGHLIVALERRFLSRVQDRRRAVSGRSPMQAALEGALVHGEAGGQASVADARCGVEELAMLRLELRDIVRVAPKLTDDQRLVLACQVGLKMSCAEFCALFGWSSEKYRKVAQRARARLRLLTNRVDENELDVPPARVGSDKEIGKHL